MRNRRNALAALVFALALSVPAFADDGIMHTGSPAPAPTPSAATTQDAASDGSTSAGDAAPASQTKEDLTEIALSVVQALTLI